MRGLTGSCLPGFLLPSTCDHVVWALYKESQVRLTTLFKSSSMNLVHTTALLLCHVSSHMTQLVTGSVASQPESLIGKAYL